MSHQQLHDFASTPDKGLPEHAEDGRAPQRFRYMGSSSGPVEAFPSAHSMDGITHQFAKRDALAPHHRPK